MGYLPTPLKERSEKVSLREGARGGGPLPLPSSSLPQPLKGEEKWLADLGLRPRLASPLCGLAGGLGGREETGNTGVLTCEALVPPQNDILQRPLKGAGVGSAPLTSGWIAPGAPDMAPARLIPEPAHPTLLLYASLLKQALLAPRSLLLTQVALEGRGHDGSTASLTYLGEGESLGYIKSLIFQEATAKRSGTVPCWQLPRWVAAARSSGSLAVIEIDRLLSFLLPAGGFLSYPWIRQKIFLTSDLFRQRRRWVEGSPGRRVRKYGYRFRLAGPEAVAPFYHQFYVPYIRHRFGEWARPRSLRELTRAVRSGFLLQVYDGEDWVAGEVYRRQGDSLLLSGIGCIPPYDHNLRRGVLSVSQYFGMQWALQHGILVLDMGRSRPHGADGVFRHKHHWGAQPFVDPWVHTGLWLFLPPDRGLPQGLEQLFVVEKGELVELGRVWSGDIGLEPSPAEHQEGEEAKAEPP